MATYKDFGIKMKDARNKHKWSLIKLGEKSNVSASFLSDIETGKSFPSMERAYEISVALDVPLSWLLGEIEADDSFIKSVERAGVMFLLFLNKYIFPNGLTYREMNERIILLEKLKNIKNINKA